MRKRQAGVCHAQAHLFYCNQTYCCPIHPSTCVSISDMPVMNCCKVCSVRELGVTTVEKPRRSNAEAKPLAAQDAACTVPNFAVYNTLFSAHLEQIITEAPSAASRSAMPKPMPAVAAVTMATLPCRRLGSSMAVSSSLSIKLKTICRVEAALSCSLEGELVQKDVTACIVPSCTLFQHSHA